MALISVGLIRLVRPWRTRRQRGSELTSQTLLAMFGAMVLAGPIMLIAGQRLGWVSAAPPNDADRQLWTAVISLALVSAGSALVAIVWLVALRKVQRPAEEGCPRHRFALRIGTGVLGFLMITPWVFGATQAAAWLDEWISGRATPVLAHESLAMMASARDPAAWWVFAGLVVTAVPIFEEIMYRGLLQSLMRSFGLGAWPAILLASAIFVAMHIGTVQPAGLAGLFVLSIGLGLAYERTGSIVTPAVIHGLFNAVNVTALWLMS